ncbi:hypothetical protein TNCV_147931 [Trichonephila clavipes]|nr:hypothetical protein TNCV_147931 [Trichonephila clavipes]
MFDPSSFANPTPLAHADTSRDVLPRGDTSHFVPLFYSTPSMGHFLKKEYINTSSSRLFFIRPGFSRHRSLFFPRSPSSLLSLPGPSLYLDLLPGPSLYLDLLPGAGSRSLHSPPKSKICPLWLILPFQTPGTENSQTVKQKIHKQNTQ